MIDIRKLKELVRLMVENELTELDLRDSEEQVTMRRPNAMATPQVVAGASKLIHAVPAAATGGSPAAATTVSNDPLGAPPAAALPEDANLIPIQSPMVGTFYATANPDSPPFVTVGTAVTPDKVVCIIEAMKIFNEIKAECTGVIQKVLVKSGQAVEFGQPLFLVKPA
jgi:acetyl-CoA carboxylase biotin carboxyl carrier protein